MLVATIMHSRIAKDIQVFTAIIVITAIIVMAIQEEALITATRGEAVLLVNQVLILVQVALLVNRAVLSQVS